MARFRLKRLRSLMPGSGVLTIILLVLAVAGFAITNRYPQFEWVWPLIAVLMLAVFFAPISLRGPTKSRGETYAEITRVLLRIPRNSGSDRHDELRLDEIEALMLRGDEPHGFIFISNARKSYVLSLGSFIEPGDAQLFHQQLREKISAQRGGKARLEEIDRRNIDSLGSVRSRGVATQLVLAVLAIAFLVERAAGGFDSPFALLRFGANARALVFDGQWYRLFAANLLHANEVHLVMNAIAIFSLGFMVERLLGPARFMLVFFIAALAGSMASLFSPVAAMSVGASTAVFGLFAAFAYLQLRFRTKMPAGFHSPLRAWGWVLALNVAISIWVPQIDLLAHLGGFVGGLIAVYLVTSADDRFPLPPAPKGQLIAVGVLSALFIAGAVKASEGIGSTDRTDESRVLASIGQQPHATEVLNEIAWTLATKPKATTAELAVALECAERSIALETKHEFKLMEQDTLATIHFRMGNVAQAIELEAQVLNDPRINDVVKDQDRFIATQLARFMAAYVDKDQPRLKTATTSSAAENTLGEYYVARADSGAQIVGLIVRRATDPKEPTIPESWPKDTQLSLGLTAPLRFDTRAWDADQNALQLP